MVQAITHGHNISGHPLVLYVTLLSSRKLLKIRGIIGVFVKEVTKPCGW